MKRIKQSLRFKIFFFFLFVGITTQVRSQEKYVLQFVEKNKVRSTNINDTLKIQKEVDETIKYYLNRGHLAVRVDSVIKSNNAFKVFVYIGNKYKWGRFRLSEYSDVSFLKRNFINIQNKNIDVASFVELRKKAVAKANNQGFPYAKFQLNDIKNNADSLSATIDFQLGTKVLFDQLDVEENVMTKQFLQAYLGIKEGSVFSSDKIKSIPLMINKLKGVRLDGNVNVLFYQDVCKVSFKLRKSNDDKVDGLIGLQTSAVQKSEVIGHLRLSLNNLFKSSKKINLEWKKPSQLNQILNLELDNPNFFRSNLGVGVSLNLFKKDTSFLNVSYSFSTYYQVRNQKLLVKIIRERSSLFNAELKTDSLRSFKGGQTVLQYSFDNLVGTPLNYEGMEVVASLGVQNLTEIDSTISFTSARIKIKSEFNQKIVGHLGIKQKIVGFSILSDRVFVNQMEVVGGFSTIRGFNENQFFVKQYFLGSSAVVFHLSQEANISLFSDYGKLTTSYGNENVISFGTGFEKITNNSIFKFAYAIGRSLTQEFSFTLSKVHVGIATKF